MLARRTWEPVTGPSSARSLLGGRYLTLTGNWGPQGLEQV